VYGWHQSPGLFLIVAFSVGLASVLIGRVCSWFVRADSFHPECMRTSRSFADGFPWPARPHDGARPGDCLPIAYSGKWFAGFSQTLAVASGVLSIGFGCFLSYRIGVVNGLLTSHPHWTPR